MTTDSPVVETYGGQGMLEPPTRLSKLRGKGGGRPPQFKLRKAEVGETDGRFIMETYVIVSDQRQILVSDNLLLNIIITLRSKL